MRTQVVTSRTEETRIRRFIGRILNASRARAFNLWAQHGAVRTRMRKVLPSLETYPRLNTFRRLYTSSLDGIVGDATAWPKSSPSGRMEPMDGDVACLCSTPHEARASGSTSQTRFCGQSMDLMVCFVGGQGNNLTRDEQGAIKCI